MNCQVVDRGSPLRVAPFGKHPGWSPNEPNAEFCLSSRSPDLILPHRSGPTQLRFSEKTFSASSVTLDSRTFHGRKGKASESNLVSRWCDARDLMLKAHQDAHDGMPLLLSRYIDDSTSRQRASLKCAKSSISVDESEGEGKAIGSGFSYVPRAENVFYDVPGELVLAKERSRDTYYWPGKLMKFIAPTKASEKPLYEVLFFDGLVKRMQDDTDMFYTPMHDGFKTCKVWYDYLDVARLWF